MKCVFSHEISLGPSKRNCDSAILLSGYKISPMALFFCLLIFLYQTDSAASQCAISNCDPDSCTYTNCTKCVEGYYEYTPTKCELCYIHCRSCGIDVCYRCVHDNCHGCMYGNCTSGCATTGSVPCTSCPDGYFLGSEDRCYRCPYANCKCSVTENCTECVPGKYGRICQLDCISTCQNGTCDKFTGMCSDKCPTHQYLHSYRCRHCSPRCMNCSDLRNCSSCSRFYNWGPYCQYDCTGCFGKCSKDNGCSTECDIKYYPIYNALKNGNECIRCPNTCVTCNNAVECTSCETGYWGSYCQHNCSGCVGECNKNDGCHAGCHSGYYQRVINGGEQCVKCTDNCVICSKDTICDECKTGYYSPDQANCIVCSNSCRDGACTRYNGVCTKGCLNGWMGQRCQQRCSSGCLQCEQYNSSSCWSCGIGFYGDSCERNCSSHCKQEDDGLQTCQKTDGTCIKGCTSGYWGQTCTSECGRGCYGNQCNETTGICLNGCKDKFYGNRCDKEWPCETNYEEDDQEKTVGTDKQRSSCQENSTIVALSVVTGIAVLVAVVSITANIILLKRGRFDFLHKRTNASAHVSEEQELDNNVYQDLNRIESSEAAYSTVKRDSENAL